MKTLRAQLEVKNAGVRRDNSQLEEGGSTPQRAATQTSKPHTQDITYFQDSE